MNIDIKGTNLDLTVAISDYATKKFDAISKFIDRHSPDTICHVVLSKTSDHHKHGDIFRAEARLHLKGHEIFVEEETSDLYASIDKVRDEMLSKLSMHKDKKVSLARRGGAKIKSMIKGLWGNSSDTEATM